METEFINLGREERKLFLYAIELGDKLDDLHCQYCKGKVEWETCGIMPPVKTTRQAQLATITCSSPLCISAYLCDREEEDENTKEM